MTSTDTRPLAIFLMGPTATGKTDLACALAEQFPLDLVSVDSALVYRGLDIGSAKPDAATLARHPHALIDIRDPATPYSAADFSTDARAAMAQTTQSGRVPLLVGGTGLYFRALQQGLSPMPEADTAVRERIRAQAETEGWPALHAQLQRLDPKAAARIGPRDAQRLSRALEVIECSGRPFSEQQQGSDRTPFPWRVLKLALAPRDRAQLHARIAERVDRMLAHGLIDEVQKLHERADLHASLPAMRAVGYRQTWQYLDGQLTERELAQRIVFATRQLAKRQTTWLRREWDARWIDPVRQGMHATAQRAVELFVRGADAFVCRGRSCRKRACTSPQSS